MCWNGVAYVREAEGRWGGQVIAAILQKQQWHMHMQWYLAGGVTPLAWRSRQSIHIDKPAMEIMHYACQITACAVNASAANDIEARDTSYICH